MGVLEDREKVIKGLECCLAVTKCGICPYNNGNDLWCGNSNQLLEDAIALLKAQEPVKPIMRHVEFEYDTFSEWENKMYCPKCKMELLTRVNYCPNCGMAVKWDG